MVTIKTTHPKGTTCTLKLHLWINLAKTLYALNKYRPIIFVSQRLPKVTLMEQNISVGNKKHISDNLVYWRCYYYGDVYLDSQLNQRPPPSNSVLIYWNFHHYNFAIRDCWQNLQNKSFENWSALYFGMINYFFCRLLRQLLWHASLVLEHFGGPAH